MNRISRLDEPPSAEVEALYSEILAHGFGDRTPINFFTAMAHRPDLLKATWDLAKAVLVEGLLPGSLKQMIALCISRQNDCRYCSVMHRGALEMAGVAPNVVESCASDPTIAGLAEPHRSIVRLAMVVAESPDSVKVDDLRALLDLGLSHDEVVELLVLAAFTNFINAWADISDIPLDATS